MTPHGHSWRAAILFQGIAEAELDRSQMMTEFSGLKKGWKNFIQTTVDHSFLHHEADPLVEHLRVIVPQFRGLPFPGDPTTEMVAACFLWKAHVMNEAFFGEEPRMIPVGIEVQETETNRVEFYAADVGAILESVPDLRGYEGWWKDSDPQARWMERSTHSGVATRLTAEEATRVFSDQLSH